MTPANATSVREVGRAPLLLSLVALALVLFLISIAVGPTALSVVPAAVDRLSGVDSVQGLILTEIRLPRAILGFAIGAALGLAGAALQGLLRNPLADPGLIGVSGTAGLGAVIVLYSGLSIQFPLALPLGGMGGALIAVVALFILAGRSGGVLTLILAGIAINALAAALTTLALNMAPSPYAVVEIVFWLLGSLKDRSMDHVLLAVPPIAVGCLLLLGTARGLDAMTLGQETAQSLGFNMETIRWRIVVGAAIAVGAAVAVAGTIGFIGLIVPHLLRPLVGYRPGRLLAASALGGGSLLLGADILIRIIAVEPELQIGVVSALIGAPFFLYLVLSTRRDYA